MLIPFELVDLLPNHSMCVDLILSLQCVADNGRTFDLDQPSPQDHQSPDRRQDQGPRFGCLSCFFFPDSTPLSSAAVISFDRYMQLGEIQAVIGTFVRTLMEYVRLFWLFCRSALENLITVRLKIAGVQIQTPQPPIIERFDARQLATFEFILRLSLSRCRGRLLTLALGNFANCPRENSSRPPGPPWVPHVFRLSLALHSKVIG